MLFPTVDKHQVPISRMGNYQQHLKELSPLRELDTGAVKTQLFGNPFRLEKASSKVGGNGIDCTEFTLELIATCISIACCQV